MKKWVSFFVLTSVLVLFNHFAQAIEKCQDADGKWHYGDVAACENAKITTMNEHGAITAEQEAPKPEAELRAEEEELAAANAKKELERQAELERNRILSVYETEDDIDRQRDNQLYSVQSNIDVHKAYLKSMGARISRKKTKLATTTHPAALDVLKKEIADSESSLDSYEAQLVLLRKHKEDIVKKFEKEKELYRELTGAESN